MATSATPITHIFVYGTLLSASKKPMARFLRQFGQFVEPGFFPGRLYDLGTYPGAVFEPDSAALVHGEVYSFRESEANDLLRTLDDYEGHEYDRMVVSVQTATGFVNCWVYIFNQPIDLLPCIETGRYLV